MSTSTIPTLAEQTHIAAAEAAAALADASARLDEAREVLDDLEHAKGSGAVTAPELIAARTEVEIAEAVHRTAAGKAAAAESAILATDLTLGRLVADALAQMFEGDVPVTVSNEAPTSMPDTLPVAVVVQRKPHSPARRGGVGGTVEVHYLRTRLHTALDLGALVAGLADGEVFVKGTRGTVDGSVSLSRIGDRPRDIAQLKIERAYGADVPTMPSEVDALGITLAVQTLAQDHMDCRLKPINGYTDPHDFGEYLGGPPPFRRWGIDVKHDDVRTLANDVDSDGIRRRVVEVPIDFRMGTHSRNIADDLRSALVRHQVGKVVAGLGRVTSVEVTTSAAHGRYVAVTLRAGAVSRDA